MSVNVASGWGAIVSSTANAGVYTFYNDATTNLTVTTADPSNPRIDRVVVTVNDSAYSGATNNVTFTVVAGTPAASPTAPATPTNSISLATIAVAAGTTSIVAGNITDTRILATSSLVSGLALPLSGGTLTGGLVTTPSTASVSPIKLQSSGTFLNPVVGGSVEWDGVTAYFTPIAAGTGGHGLLPSRFFYGLSANRTLAAGITTAQSLFNVGLPLAGSTTYEIEIQAQLSITDSASTANTLSAILNFSSTPTSVDASLYSGNGATSATNIFAGATPTAASITISTTSAQTVSLLIKGIVRTNAATTFTPQVILSSGVSIVFTANRNSFVKVTPIGSSTVQAVGAWA